MKKIFKKSNIMLICIILFFYYFLFIFRSSFKVDNERYFVLLDDVMISMRYAKNFANGNGLVWNKGEKIEGITNPLWTLYMSIFHLLPIPQSKISLFIQVSGLLFTILTTIFIYKISLLITKTKKIAITSSILYGFYYPSIYWNLMGCETSILTLLSVISIYLVLKKKNFSILPYIILGFSTYIRFDAIVLYLSVWIYLLIFDKKNLLKNLFSGLTILTFFISTQTIARYLYYGDFLPNTYYLKMSGFPNFYRITRGIYVYIKFLWNLNIILVFLFILPLFIKRNKNYYLLYAVFLFQSLYSIYVGGDAWEQFGGSNRFVSIVMPYFFIVFSYSLIVFSRIKFPKRVLLPLCVIFSIISFNSSYGPEANVEALLILEPKYVKYNRNWTEIGVKLNDYVNEKARVAVVLAGVLPYFFKGYCIDILGKNDRYIANLPARKLYDNPLPISFYPGHMKWDYKYSLEFLRPDIIVDLWYYRHEAENILKDNFVNVNFLNKYSLLFRKDSENILWEKLKAKK